jgi:hypothetical protein
MHTKVNNFESAFYRARNIFLTRLLLAAAFLLATIPMAHAQIDPGGGGGTNAGPTYVPLNTWSFNDHTSWTSDTGYAPASFTNLDSSNLGNGHSLVVDTNLPAWLRYNIFENDGTTNLTVDTGTVTFWFAPNWSGTNQGGAGPGAYGRLLEVGAYTTNSNLGWWSIYTDNAGDNLYFSAQTNNSSGTFTNYISLPIAWTTNYFHFITLTYTPTNTALYLDGTLATNGPGVTVYPGSSVLANGFTIGSSTNGSNQAHGFFNSLQTFNVPLDAGTIQQIFSDNYDFYMINPLNTAMESLSSATSDPTFTDDSYSAISGAGNLQWVSSAPGLGGTNAYQVWITNVTAVAAGNGTMNVTFTIAGGLDGFLYDVFATGALQGPLANGTWVWLGQGSHCNTYTVNIPTRKAFLILGTPLDSNGDGITDAYSKLVAQIDPNAPPQNDAYGVPYAWYLQNGLNPMSGGQDPDHDGLLNYQEYLFGTKPQVSEGFSIWTTAGNSNIP